MEVESTIYFSEMCCCGPFVTTDTGIVGGGPQMLNLLSVTVSTEPEFFFQDPVGLGFYKKRVQDDRYTFSASSSSTSSDATYTYFSSDSETGFKSTATTSELKQNNGTSPCERYLAVADVVEKSGGVTTVSIRNQTFKIPTSGFYCNWDTSETDTKVFTYDVGTDSWTWERTVVKTYTLQTNEDPHLCTPPANSSVTTTGTGAPFGGTFARTYTYEDPVDLKTLSQTRLDSVLSVLNSTGALPVLPPGSNPTTVSMSTGSGMIGKFSSPDADWDSGDGAMSYHMAHLNLSLEAWLAPTVSGEIQISLVPHDFVWPDFTSPATSSAYFSSWTQTGVSFSWTGTSRSPMDANGPRDIADRVAVIPHTAGPTVDIESELPSIGGVPRPYWDTYDYWNHTTHPVLPAPWGPPDPSQGDDWPMLYRFRAKEGYAWFVFSPHDYSMF